jgi:Flp pilus assembly pilin Flp
MPASVGSMIPGWRTSVGQGLVEYGLILALTIVLTVVWLVVFGGAIADALAAIGGAIDAATGG